MLQDVIVLPHGGGPLPLLGEPSHKSMTDWLAKLPATLLQPPTAVLIVSAHWEASEPTLLSGPAPDLLFDYHGFPKSAYELTYPAKGAPQLAKRVHGLLEAAGFPARLDVTRGFDHGAFIPMMIMYPDADVPVIQLSLLKSLDAGTHLRLGRVLAPLRSEGVLLVASGMHSFHNMAGFFASDSTEPLEASSAFDEWVTQAVTAVAPQERERLLVDWEALAPRARFVHPREEHLLPLLVAVGAAGNSAGVRALETTILGTKASAFLFRDHDGNH